jgi:hypothetical protein
VSGARPPGDAVRVGVLVSVPPAAAFEVFTRLVFEWRNPNFGPQEVTEVEVRFDATASGTYVTVEHSGWVALPPDHPARHGQPVAEFSRMLGRWWGDLMTALREHVSTRG